MPVLLLHDTGALFKVCRFMEVEGDVLFQIGRIKAEVYTSGTSKEGRPGELLVPASSSAAATGFPGSSWVSSAAFKAIALSSGRQVPKKELCRL